MAKSKRIGSGKQPDWQLTEHVVALLEQAIAPGARVEHDVKLWDYEAGEPRQCDVVIRQGMPPRETITMVEVQARGRRVTLPVFEAWCKKRENVRAQHLICVSQKGFSASVVRSVERQGHNVRLVELRELEETAWPVKFRNGKLDVNWPDFSVDSVKVETVGSKFPAETFKGEDVSLTRNGRPTDADKVFDHFPPIGPPVGEGEFTRDERIDFGSDDEVIMAWEGDSARVTAITRRLKVTGRWTVLTISASEYKQIDYEGVLAWAVEGVGEVDGRETALRVIFRPLTDGMLKLVGFQTSGPLADNPVAAVELKVEG